MTEHNDRPLTKTPNEAADVQPDLKKEDSPETAQTPTQTLASLRRRAVELQQRLDSIHRDYRRGLQADSEERAQELENAEVLNEIERVTAEALAAVKLQISKYEEA